MQWSSAILFFLALASLTGSCVADTITMTSSTVPTMMLAPSSDSITFDPSVGVYETSAGSFVLQTGSFIVGNSAIPDQTISFSFQDTITLEGITQTLTFYGQDDVTDAADVLTISGGTPVTFGDEVLTLQTLSLTASNIGELPIGLEVSVTPTPTPEPSSFVLVGTGLLTGLIVLVKRTNI